MPLETGQKANKYGVFANNEICLRDIKVYGFDYDYTLASYTEDVHHVLYDLGKESLIKNYKVDILVAYLLHICVNILSDKIQGTACIIDCLC